MIRPDNYTRRVTCMGFHWSYGSHTGPVHNPWGIEHAEGSKSPARGPYEAPAGATPDPGGVLPFICQKYKCGAMSSCMGSVDWCDHKDGTGIKILTSASLLRAGNRTGAKNRTGPAVECDWGICNRAPCVLEGCETLSGIIYEKNRS